MDTEAPVTIAVNEESAQIPAMNARNKTVSQLFAEYGPSQLNIDPARIQRYVLNNQLVPGDTVVRPGETVRGSVTSESKG